MTFEQVMAIMDLNSMCESRYGTGPLEDSYASDKRKIRAAIRLAKKSGYDTTEIQEVLGL